MVHAFLKICFVEAVLMGTEAWHLCYLCLVFVMLSRLFIAALWSPAGKGLSLGSCL